MGETIACAVLGYGLVVTAPIHPHHSVGDFQSCLLTRNPSIFKGYAAHNLLLRLATHWNPSSDSLEQQLFLTGKLSLRVLDILAQDALAPHTRLAAIWPLPPPPTISLLVWVQPSSTTATCSTTYDSRAIIHEAQWFPHRTLQYATDTDSAPFFEIAIFSQQRCIRPLPPPSERVLVRRCFVTVFDQLLHCVYHLLVHQNTEKLNGLDDDDATPITTPSSRRVLVVTGSRGIGKQRFFFYCALRFLFDDHVLSTLPRFRLVISFAASCECYVHDPTCGGRFVRVDSAVEMDALAKDPLVVRLLSGYAHWWPPCGGQTLVPPPIPTWRGVTICVSSPSYGEMPCVRLTPQTTWKTWMLPVWTLAELRVVNAIRLVADPTHRLCDVALRRHFAHFGGIIARVLDRHLQVRLCSDVGSALHRCSLQRLVDRVRRPNPLPDESDRSDVLLHMVAMNTSSYEVVADTDADADTTTTSSSRDGWYLVIASKRIAETLVSHLEYGSNALRSVAAFTMEPNDHHHHHVRTDAVRRELFDRLSHRRLLAIGADLTLTRLSHDPTAETETEICYIHVADDVPFKQYETLASVLALVVGETGTSSMVYYRPLLLTAYCHAVDALLVDFTQQQCYLVKFTTVVSDVESVFCKDGGGAMAADELEDAVAQAMAVAVPDATTTTSSMKLAVVLVVPPWLYSHACESVHQLKTTKTTIHRRLPWYVAALDPTH